MKSQVLSLVLLPLLQYYFLLSIPFVNGFVVGGANVTVDDILPCETLYMHSTPWLKHI